MPLPSSAACSGDPRSSSRPPPRGRRPSRCALRRLAEQRHTPDEPHKARRPRRPRRPPSRPPARTELELLWRIAGEQLRELEQAGQRLYSPAVRYQEWLPSWTPPSSEG